MIQFKALQQQQKAIHRTMDQLLTLGFIRTPNIWVFTQIVKDLITADMLPQKAKLKINSNDIAMKRNVPNYKLLSTDILKTKIEKILNDDSGIDYLFKAMEFWEKLVDLGRDDAKNYPLGKYTTLYYTGRGSELALWTKEECEENNFPLLNPMGQAIPNEDTYLKETNKLKNIYNASKNASSDESNA